MMFSWAICTALLALTCAPRAVADTYPPNYFLGTCLSDSWVASIEASLGVSSTERDSSGRLVYPFLQSALQHARYTLDDPRTASSEAYASTCMTSSMQFFGTGATSGTDQMSGSANGTLILDTRGWNSHTLVTLVFSILAQEVVGYNIGIFHGSSTIKTTERMSSVREGLCAPTHANLEVWSSGIKNALAVYSNESYAVGGVGYYGISGIYTTKDYVVYGENDTLNSPLFFANYWKHYQYDDRPITANGAYIFFNNSKYYPPREVGCADGVLGCLDACSKALACTEREAEGKECLVVIMMYDNYDRGYFQASMSNLGIPAYFCFIGYDDTAKYALEAQANGSAVLFYHFEPDMFHVAHAGLFERVALPRALPERVALGTGDYGENGYGKATNNPVDVDFPSNLLMKYAASILSDVPISSLLTKFSLGDLDITDLLSKYKDTSADSTIVDPYFEAACGWVKENYDVWRLWLERLPLCDFSTHISYIVTGCDNSSSYREIIFQWIMPNPDNTSLPYECDGGYAVLPEALVTSRSCEWVESRSSIWVDWITNKPECDSTFYTYDVSECNSNAERIITFRWLLPSSTDESISAECEDGDSLPDRITVDCEYMPTSTVAVKVVTVLCSIGFAVLLAALVVVYRDRQAPIIKRSQYELLMLMIFGGYFTIAAPIAYAGEPTDFLCGIRPILVSLGFTSIFGSLVVKSLRVYRVFMQKAMKRTTITLRMMIKVQAIFYLIDITIFVIWGIVDFPRAKLEDEYYLLIQGNLQRITCQSSSFIFTALLMFWKAILLFLGLYLSFLIRKVSVDFQESMWIFASAVVVLFACLVILPLAYIVDMSAAAFYVFLSGVLILCTGTVIALMIVPKLLRLQEADSSKQSAPSSAATAIASKQSGEPTTSNTDGDPETSPPGGTKYYVRPSLKAPSSAASAKGLQNMVSVETLSKAGGDK